MTARADIFDRLDALADGTRSRLLLVLEAHEMTVSELRSVLQLPQSTVSRHLKILADEGWVTSRPDGSSHCYRMATHRLQPAARELWELVRAEVRQTSTAVHDAARVRSVVGARRTKSREFFSSAAGQWDGLRRELFGSRPELGALPALLAGDWVVGDLGSGTGQLAEALSPFVAKIIAVRPGVGCRHSLPRVALRGGPRMHARRGAQGAPGGWAAVDHRHDASWARGVPNRDGACMAGVLGGTNQRLAGGGRVRSACLSYTASGPGREGTNAVCGECVPERRNIRRPTPE